MGREKSQFHIKDRVLEKTSVKCQSKSRPAKRPNRNKKELEVDSLMFLRDLKDKKEGNGLDEKIKLLKSELKMLLGESKLENSHNKCGSSCGSGLVIQNLPNDKYDQKKPLVLEPETEVVRELNLEAAQSEKPLPTKFSECLDKTDEITVDSQNQKELSLCDDLLLNSKHQKGSTPERFPADESSSNCVNNVVKKSSCVNSSSQSQHRVENLLYKSFYLQNFEIYLSSSDENDPDQTKSTKTLRQRKKRTRKSCKSSKGKLYQSSSNRSYRPSHRGRKKRRVARSSSQSNVVPACNSASCSHNVLKEKNVEFVDLDVSDYDWSEPFEIDENIGAFSDVEVLQNPGEERADVSDQIRGRNSNPVKHDLSAISDLGKNQLKNAWECPICFEMSKGQEVVATQCGHVFCKKCLERYMAEFNKNCPTCRTDLSNRPVITLFNF